MILNEFTMLQGIGAGFPQGRNLIFLIIGVIGIFTEQLHLTANQIDPRSKFCKQLMAGSYEDTNTAGPRWCE